MEYFLIIGPVCAFYRCRSTTGVDLCPSDSHMGQQCLQMTLVVSVIELD